MSCCHGLRSLSVLLSMWGKIKSPIYRLWFHGLYGLHGPRCKRKAVMLHDDVMALIRFTHYLPFVMEIHLWIHFRKGSNAELLSICCYSEQAEQQIKLSVISDAMTPIWRHCHVIDMSSWDQTGTPMFFAQKYTVKCSHWKWSAVTMPNWSSLPSMVNKLALSQISELKIWGCSNANFVATAISYDKVGTMATFKLKMECCHDANFVVSGGTTGCPCDNRWCHQLRQSWHYHN